MAKQQMPYTPREFLLQEDFAGEPTFAMRCVACDGPITGRSYTPIVSKYGEYCPTCEAAIESAKAAERVHTGVQGEGEREFNV